MEKIIMVHGTVQIQPIRLKMPTTMSAVDASPSKAISFDDRQEIDGVYRWQINSEACFTYWCTIGTDCARCMSVCPYSHPDNTLHNLVRAGLKRSGTARQVALKLDDFFYGRQPEPLDLPDWIDDVVANGKGSG